MGMLGGLARASSSCYCSTSTAGCSLVSLRSLRRTPTPISSIAAIACDAPRGKREALSSVHSQQHQQQHHHHSRRFVSSFFVSCPPSVLGRSDRRAIMTGGGVVKAVLTSEVGLTKPAAPVVPEVLQSLLSFPPYHSALIWHVCQFGMSYLLFVGRGSVCQVLFVTVWVMGPTSRVFWFTVMVGWANPD